MAQRKPSTARAKPAPDYYFVKELAGEQPPSRQIMEELFGLALQFCSFELWELLTEDQLVIVDAPDGSGACYCSLMGMRGEIHALQIYLGHRGFQFFVRAHAGEIRTAGEFYGTQRSVYVHFVMPGELDARDRELMRALKHPYQRTLSPQFRSVRPGYFPWYVTEAEAQILAHCLRAMVPFAQRITEEPDLEYWATEKLYPKIESAVDGHRYEIRMVEPPTETLTMPRMPALDMETMDLIKRTMSKNGPAIEVDHFFGGAKIGRRAERKACVRMALAIDAETAYAFKPEMEMPEASTGEMLVRAVLNAVAQTEAIPGEVRVRDREHKTLLGPLGDALGCPVKLVASLPALDFARGEILAMMGDPGGLVVE